MVIMIVVALYSIAVFFLVTALLGNTSVGVVMDKTMEIHDRVSRFRSPLDSLGKKFPKKSRSRLERKIILAGSPKNLTLDGLISLKLLAIPAALLITILLVISVGVAPAKLPVILVAASAGAFFLPDLWLNSLITKRQKEIRRALPDTLDLLTVSIEAGLGFDAALSKVVKNTDTALSTEFYRLLQEIQLGVSRKEAFKNLEARTEVPELNSFILAILQAEVFGISIGKVLRVQSKEMRIKRRQRAEEMAMKAPVKIVFPLLLCIFPALNIVILGPAAIQIYNNLFI